jgi:hypothetical protein
VPAQKRFFIVNVLKLCSYTVLRLLVVVVIISSLLVPPAYSQDTEDSQIFISGFNAYQQKNYPAAIEKMTTVLARYPDTPLRDMALFWLSRACFKNGNQRDAAKYMSQFSKEYPDNPLRSTVDEDLLALTARYDKGETLPVGTLPPALADRPLVAQKAGSEQERLAKEQAEKERLAKLQDEQKRLAAVKAEQERIAEATRQADLKAEQDRKASDQARLKPQKAEQERAAAAEAARVAETRKEQERLAALKAEEQRAVETARLAEINAEQKRKAAEQATARKAEDERLAVARAEEQRAAAAEATRLAAAQKEQERLAARKTDEQRAAEAARAAEAKAEQERKAAEQARVAARKAEEDRLAADKAEKLRVAEAARLAEVKAEQERKAAEKSRIAAQKAEQERLAAEQADMTLVAKQQAELVRQSMAKAELKAAKAREAQTTAGAAEAAKVAALKAEAKRKNEEAVEQTRLAAVKAEEDRIAHEKTSVSQKDVDEAEQKKLAALTVEQERNAARQTEQRRADREKAERERVAALQREQDQIKSEQERVASERVEKERVAAETERIASIKRDQDRAAAERASADAAETARLAVLQKELDRGATTRVNDKKPVRPRDAGRTAKSVLREKAIEQYKSIIEKYPTSASAAAAAAKLRELGVSVAIPQQQSALEPQPENARILNLEVAQFAGVEINLPDQPQAYPVARRLSIPFELVNRGNGTDSFYLESGFPKEFASFFAAQSSPEAAVNLTPSIAPGESFKGVISLLMPASSIDGRRVNYPFKAASRLIPEATQSRTVTMTASAPLVRAVIKSDKSQPLPGEKVIYRVAILNVGSAAAQDVSFRLNFPPQMEPVDYASSGFRQEMKAALVIDGLQIKSGESKEFSLAFQLKEDSMAGQELVARAELTDNTLKTNTTFVSTASYVRQQRGIQVRPASERLVVIPGQTINVPFVVTNTGNGRERLTIASNLKGAQDVVIFHDLNRDGIRQASEPTITEIGPLAPKEEVSVVMEIKTPRSAADGSDGLAQISFSSDADVARTFTGATRLAYSRPVLDMVMTGGGSGRLKPGEVASFDLTITNRGSNLARVVDLQSAWPDKLELVAADPVNNSASNSAILWKFKELGAGEKRTIKVSFRVKSGTSMGTNIQVKNVLSYEDQLGNRY